MEQKRIGNSFSNRRYFNCYESHGKPEDGIKRWNAARRHINRERLVYVFCETKYTMSYDEMVEFKKVEGKKLLILNKSPYVKGFEGSMIHVPVSPFFQDTPIERDFDFLGWLNNN